MKVTLNTPVNPGSVVPRGLWGALKLLSRGVLKLLWTAIIPRGVSFLFTTILGSVAHVKLVQAASVLIGVSVI